MQNMPEAVQTVLFNIRLPRILVGMLVGAVLSAAGAVYQGMFRNPLVSPDILGASAGAGFGAAFAIWCSWGIVGIQLSAFVCGLAAVLSAWGLSCRMRHAPMLALVLSGMLISTLFSAGTAAVKYIADPLDKLPAITFWLMGSLAACSTRDAASACGRCGSWGLCPFLSCAGASMCCPWVMKRRRRWALKPAGCAYGDHLRNAYDDGVGISRAAWSAGSGSSCRIWPA